MAHLFGADRATRLWCLVASLAPDVDGLGIVCGVETYQRWHHVLAHNLLFAALIVLGSLRCTGRRAGPSALISGCFLIHLAGDYVGSGPGWGLEPFMPFSGRLFLCPFV